MILASVVSPWFVDALNLTQVVTSEGVILRDTCPMFRFNVHSIAQEGDQIQTERWCWRTRRIGFSGIHHHPIEVEANRRRKQFCCRASRRHPTDACPWALPNPEFFYMKRLGILWKRI